MDGIPDKAGREISQSDPLPARLVHGGTVLLASAGDPTQYAVDLRAICEYGTAADAAFVVTMTESAERTLEAYEQLDSGDSPSVGLVDTTADQPSVSAIYGEQPVIFTPSPGDLERLVLALSNLLGYRSLEKETRHLVVRSLTPILEAAGTSRVRTVLEQLTDVSSQSGLCLLGIDYTRHDEETITALAEQVDGILWITQTESEQLEFEYQPARSRYTQVLQENND